MGKRKDLDLYRLVESDGKLRYEYQGAWHVPSVSPPFLLRIKILLLLGCVIQAILVFLMGKLDFPSFRKLYVIIPFLAVLFSAGKSFIAAVMLFTWRDRMTLRQHQLSWHSLAVGSLASAVSGGLLLMSVLMDVLFFGGHFHEEWPLLLLNLPQAVLALFLHFFMKEKPCLVRPNLNTASAGEAQDRISE